MNLRNVFLTMVVIVGAIFAVLLDGDNTTSGEGFQKGDVAPVAQVALDLDYVDVVRVVDGDTIVVLVNGKKESIRFLGINTPESVDPRRPIECFGREASKEMKSLVKKHDAVLLVKDPAKGDRDKYGRLLRYVYRASDNLFLNEYMVQEGYAYEYTYEGTYEFKDHFKQLQKEAQEAGRGLWAEEACAGKK